MKSILFSFYLLIFGVLPVWATDYYVSTTGNDSRTSAEATNPSTPWKTINKVNSFFPSLKPGDRILFKRGETFYGNLKVTKSGSSAAPITIGAYGTGSNPVLTGAVRLTNWVSKGGGIYEAVNSSLGSTISSLTVNNAITPMGRYPNRNATLKGYLILESYTGSSITDNELTSSINWTGGELVVRTHHWVLDRLKITSHSGTTINFTGAPTYTLKKNYGYFIQNHIKALDQLGEWAYNPSTKAVSMYFGSASPSNYDVRVSVSPDVLTIINYSYINVTGVTITGGNDNNIRINASTGTKINNCNILFAGKNGILAGNTNSLQIENSDISYSNNMGIDLVGSAHSTIIRNNDINGSGIYPGLGANGSHSYVGIRANGNNNLIELNRIDSSGYIGLRFTGDYTNIRNNVISNFCYVKDDGAGINTSINNTTANYGRKITKNIIYNGIGAKEGTDTKTVQQVSGIYIDNNSSGVTISDNTIFNCGKTGLYIRNSTKITATGNTMYNNTAQGFLNYDDALRIKTSNIIMKHNIFFSKIPSQIVAHYNTKSTEMGSFGVIDSNYYARPLDDNITLQSITQIYTTSAKLYKYTLDQWKAAHGHDGRSKKSPKTFASTVNPDDYIRFEYNPTASNKSVSLNATYVDVKNKSYSGTITIPPFSSLVLMKTGAATASPTAPTVAITSPTYNASYTAPASVRLTANTTVPSGTSVTKVEFYRGSTLITTEKIYPWDWTWNNVPAGSYSITAKVYASNGAVATSAAVPITVGSSTSAPAPTGSPYVVVTSPANGSRFNAGATIKLTATSAVPGEYIHKVEFYNGSTLLKREYGAPYEHTWTNVPAGTYTITAKSLATDNVTRTSSPITIYVGSGASVEPFDDNMPDSSSRLRLYPNPAVNMLQVELDTYREMEDVNIQIANASGVLVKNLIRKVGSRYLEIDVASLKPGVYVLSVIDSSGARSKSFLKQ